MDEFLRRAPRTVLALVAIVIGYALIIGFNPPRTVCDEQLDVFHEAHKEFLKPKGTKVSKSAAAELFDLCKTDNGPGGCFDYFINVRTMVDSLERMPKTCSSRISEDELIRTILLRTITLMAQIAWGDSSSGEYVSRKHSWLDAADFRLFCRIKVIGARFYGDETMSGLRESVMTDLPGASEMSRDQRWTRSIFSSPCD